jgi:hypothetical protein
MLENHKEQVCVSFNLFPTAILEIPTCTQKLNQSVREGDADAGMIKCSSS